MDKNMTKTAHLHSKITCSYSQKRVQKNYA